jgi:hypothetical protein
VTTLEDLICFLLFRAAAAAGAWTRHREVLSCAMDSRRTSRHISKTENWVPLACGDLVMSSVTRSRDSFTVPIAAFIAAGKYVCGLLGSDPVSVWAQSSGYLRIACFPQCSRYAQEINKQTLERERGGRRSSEGLGLWVVCLLTRFHCRD